MTEENWNLLGTRMRNNVPIQHASTFEDAVHIFPTNDLADTWNWERLQLLGTPIARINAYHNVRGCETAPADRFGCLHPHLFLAVDARVFVNNNVWTGAALPTEPLGRSSTCSGGWTNMVPPGRLPTCRTLSLSTCKTTEDLSTLKSRFRE